MKILHNDMSGRSMVEMLGVLAIVGILSVLALVGYDKAVQKSRINKTVDAVVTTLNNLGDFTLNNVSGTEIQGDNAVADAVNMKLITDCKETTSIVDSAYKACKVPAGEFYVKFVDKGSSKYSFMLFVTLNHAELCEPFLAQGWDKEIPAAWWPTTAIWVASNEKLAGQILYKDGEKAVQSTTGIQNVCAEACPDGSSYCSVIFDIGGIN